MLVTMKQILDVASKNGYAVCAPNVFSELDARGCLEAAEEKNAPIILDVGYSATKDLFFFIRMLRELAQQSCVPVAINLDHGGDVSQIYEAIQAGVTSVMIDRSALPFEENVKQVKAIVDIAHSIGVSVEAELGHVGQANNYEHDRDAALTSVEEAKSYLEQTGVDCLAVAIGTAHGAYPKGFTPYLDFERLTEIKTALNGFPLVLHGSSGTREEDLEKVCKLGINKVNVANDICRAVSDALQSADLEGSKAYGVYKVAQNAVKEKVMHLIDIYGSTGKAFDVKPRGLSKKDVTLAEK